MWSILSDIMNSLFDKKFSTLAWVLHAVWYHSYAKFSDVLFVKSFLFDGVRLCQKIMD